MAKEITKVRIFPPKFLVTDSTPTPVSASVYSDRDNAEARAVEEAQKTAKPHFVFVEVARASPTREVHLHRIDDSATD